jgi:hypothetical protein
MKFSYFYVRLKYDMFPAMHFVISFCLVFLLGLFELAFGQYRSKGSGRWQDASSWEYFDGVAYVNAIMPPNYNSPPVSVRAGHVIIIDATDTIDQVTVEAGGHLIYTGDTTVQLRLNFTSGNDLLVNGIFERQGGRDIVFAGSSSIYVNAGGVYLHSAPNGNIGTAVSFANNSVLRITGTVSSLLNVYSRVEIGTGGTFRLLAPASTINASLAIRGGTFSLAGSGAMTVTIGDSLNFVSGLIEKPDGQPASVTFGYLASSPVTYLRAGGSFSPAGCLSYVVSANKRLVLLSDVPLGYGRMLDVQPLGAVSCGIYKLVGGGDLRLQNNATFATGNSNGRDGTVALTGSLQYDSLANYEYNGSVPQLIGAGTRLVCRKLIINNPAGVESYYPAQVTDSLNLITGALKFLRDTITLLDYAEVLGVSGYVEGFYRKLIPAASFAISYVLPLGGPTGASYSEVTFATVVVGGNIVAEIVEATPPAVASAQRVLPRYLILKNNGVVFTTFDLQLSYLPSDFNPLFSERLDEETMIVGLYKSGFWSGFNPPLIDRFVFGIADGGYLYVRNLGPTQFGIFGLAKWYCALGVAPTPATVTANQTNLCRNASTSITLSTSRLGFNYQLKRGTVSIGSPVTGTGGLLVLPVPGSALANPGLNVFSIEENEILSGTICRTLLTDTAGIFVLSTPIPNRARPVAPAAVCVGDSIRLRVSNPMTGASYLWLGPSGFSSVVQDPVIVSATTSNAGTYSAYVIAGGCTSEVDTVHVPVYTTVPKAEAYQSGSVCQGGQVLLSADTVIGASYLWTGPVGFSSTLQHPLLDSVTLAQAGQYVVRAIVNSCTSATDTVVVSVGAGTNPPRPVVAAEISVCEGDTIELKASVRTGDTLYWTGPNGFSSDAAVPKISAITTAQAGDYYAVAIFGGCTSSVATLPVRVLKSVPAPVATDDDKGGVCAGETVRIFASPVLAPGVMYRWTGPNGYVSNKQNDTLINPVPGIYQVVAIAGNCTSAAGITVVNVFDRPATPKITPVAEICAGEVLSLAASFVSGSVYRWWGPNGFVSEERNPVRKNIQVADAGWYYVQAIQYGCSSLVDSVEVVVRQGVGKQTITVNGDLQLCANDSVILEAPAGFSFYRWNVIGANSRTLVVRTPGEYRVEVIDSNGCSNISDAVLVTSLPLRAASELKIDGRTTACVGESVVLTAPAGFRRYVWSGPLSSVSNQIILTNGGNVVLDLEDTTGCSYRIGPITVRFQARPDAPNIRLNELMGLTTDTIADQYQWYLGPDALPNAITNTIFPPKNGTYRVAITRSGCTQFSEPFAWTFLSADRGIFADFWLKVYPNPVSDVLILAFKPLEEAVTVEVVDVLGKLYHRQVVSAGMDTYHLATSGWAAGVYQVRVLDKNGNRLGQCGIIHY